MTARRALGRIAARTPAERRALVAVGLRLVATRAALRLLPYRTVAALYARPPRPVRPGRRARHRETRLWAVGAVAPRVLGARPCLAQALVADRALRAAGADPSLRIGVALDGGQFRAHAWVECDGAVVVGGGRSADLYAAVRPVGRPGGADPSRRLSRVESQEGGGAGAGRYAGRARAAAAPPRPHPP